MAFTWISVAMMCCPPLLGFNKPIFDEQAFICMLDWGNMAAYTITLSILVLGPSVITIIYTYFYIFSMKLKLRSGVPIHDKEYATALSENLSNPSHYMSFALIMTFWMSWAPYAILRIYTSIKGPTEVTISTLTFSNSVLSLPGVNRVCFSNYSLSLGTLSSLCGGMVRRDKQLLEGFHTWNNEPAVSLGCPGTLSYPVLQAQETPTGTPGSRRRRLNIFFLQRKKNLKRENLNTIRAHAHS